MAARILERYKNWNWAWTMAVAWGYEPIISAMKKLGNERQDNICDIGCGPRGGLGGHSGWRTIGVDLKFRDGFSKQFPTVIPVVASAFQLPFTTGSLKATVCIDVLEHLPAAQRPSLVKEAFRVTRPDGLVFIGAPCGRKVRKREQELNDIFRAHTGRDHHWLIEHLANEVITENDLYQYIEDAAAHYMPRHNICLVPNVELQFWYWSTRISWTLPGLMQIQRLMFRPIYPWLARHNGPPSYRLVAIVEGLS